MGLLFELLFSCQSSPVTILSQELKITCVACLYLLLFFAEQSTNEDWNNFKANDIEEAILLAQEKLKLNNVGIQAETSEDTKIGKTKLKSLLGQLKKFLRTKSLATKDSAKAFIQLLSTVDKTPTDELLTILKDKKFQDVMYVIFFKGLNYG
jgi:hypothetical protein